MITPPLSPVEFAERILGLEYPQLPLVPEEDRALEFAVAEEIAQRLCHIEDAFEMQFAFGHSERVSLSDRFSQPANDEHTQFRLGYYTRRMSYFDNGDSTEIPVVALYGVTLDEDGGETLNPLANIREDQLTIGGDPYTQRTSQIELDAVMDLIIAANESLGVSA